MLISIISTGKTYAFLPQLLSHTNLLSIEMRSEHSGTDVEHNEPVDLPGVLTMTEDAINDEIVNPTFDLDSSIS